MGSRPHTNALRAWLEGDASLANLVMDGHVVGEPPGRYVLVFPHRPEHETTRMADRRRENVMRYTIHCVGSIPAECEWLADRVEARLVGSPVRLIVGGKTQGLIEHESGDPLRRDEDVFFLADDYAWEATT